MNNWFQNSRIESQPSLDRTYPAASRNALTNESKCFRYIRLGLPVHPIHNVDGCEICCDYMLGGLPPFGRLRHIVCRVPDSGLPRCGMIAATLRETARQSARKALFTFTSLLGLWLLLQSPQQKEHIFGGQAGAGNRRNEGLEQIDLEGLAADVINDALDDVWDGLEDLRRIYDEQHVTVNITALNDYIRYMGRHARDKKTGSVLFDNTGFIIGFRVKGTPSVGMRYREVRNFSTFILGFSIYLATTSQTLRVATRPTPAQGHLMWGLGVLTRKA